MGERMVSGGSGFNCQKKEKWKSQETKNSIPRIINDKVLKYQPC